MIFSKCESVAEIVPLTLFEEKNFKIKRNKMCLNTKVLQFTSFIFKFQSRPSPHSPLYTYLLRDVRRGSDPNSLN